MKHFKINIINRIIDANINRAKEGLRVCEEITRFILSNRTLTESLKRLRHKIGAEPLKNPGQKSGLLKVRCSLGDVGFGIKLKSEFKRSRLENIFFANMSRVKESIRVLEEFSKLSDVKAALQFKKIRYEAYEIEKKVAEKLIRLLGHE